MPKEMITVHFNLESDSTSALISDIRSLGGTVPRKKVPVMSVEVEEDGGFLLTSVKKKKKNKKKKKKDDELEFILGGKFSSVSDMDEQVDSSMGIVDIDEILAEDDDGDELSDGIISEQKKNYNKNRKEENPFRKEFAESEALMYELLEETKKFSRELDKEYKAMNSRVRGTTKMKSELINSIISSKSTQLSIIKEISNIKKTVQDLNIKANQKNKDSEAVRSNEAVAASYLQQIIGGQGRANFLRELGATDNDHLIHERQMTALAEELVAGDTDVPIYSNQYSDEIEDRLEELGNPNRSEEGNLQIMFERLGAKLMIRRYIDKNTWEFIAVDANNQEISQYPVPDPKDVGRVKFSADGSYATDGYGRTFRVIETYSDENNQYED